MKKLLALSLMMLSVKVCYGQVYPTNIKFIPKGLLLLLAYLSFSIASAQHITSDKGYYGLSVRDSVILENKYDTIYNPLSYERGPIADFNKLDSVVYVFKEKDKYGYLIVYSKIEFGNLNQDMTKHIATTINSIEKSNVEYDSIYWRKSISRFSWLAKEEGRLYSSLLILEKANKFGFLFLPCSIKKTVIYNQLYFAGFESATVFEPRYDNFTMNQNIIVENENQYGILFSNQQIIEPQYDSIKEVASYYAPLEGYYYVWKQGKCGMIINKKLSLSIKYQVQDLEVQCEDTIAYVIIKTSSEPYTIFSPKDSTYLRIKTENGFVLNSDSIVTYLEIHQRTISPECLLYVRRYDTVGPKYKEFFPEWPGQAGIDQVYFLDKTNGTVIASYTKKESKYIIFNGMVAEITPKNHRKRKYKITIYKMFDKTILTTYTWPYYSGNTIIEILEDADGADGERHYVYGYVNSKDDFIRIGYIHARNLTFHKKIDL